LISKALAGLMMETTIGFLILLKNTTFKQVVKLTYALNDISATLHHDDAVPQEQAWKLHVKDNVVNHVKVNVIL
jgi:hypothetical protein